MNEKNEWAIETESGNGTWIWLLKERVEVTCAYQEVVIERASLVFAFVGVENGTSGLAGSVNLGRRP